MMNETIPTLPEVQGMITLVQKVLPNQYITSNRAEVFNALHDNILTYQGRKNLKHANRDLLAWAAMKFYPDSARKIINNHEWLITYRLLSKLWSFMVSDVKL